MVDVRMDEGHGEGFLELAEQAFAESDGLSLHERMHASFRVIWASATLVT